MSAARRRGRPAGTSAEGAARPSWADLPTVGFGRRLAAFAVDAVVANVIVQILATLGVDVHIGSRGELVFAAYIVQKWLLVGLLGRTAGMAVVGTRVVRRADTGRPRLLPAAVRTMLLSLVIPALISDSRGLRWHDRYAGTALVRL